MSFTALNNAAVRMGRFVQNAVLAIALAACAPLALAEEEGEWMLNIEDKPIGALINTIAKITGRNFVVDPRVEAKVSVISQRPMKPDQLYEVFLSILAVHGFAAVDAGDVTKIVPDPNAKKLAGSEGAGGGDQVVTRVINVKNVPVAELIPVLRPLVPEQSHLAAYPPTNDIIISDRAGNMERLRGIVNRIDREDEDLVEVVELEHTTAIRAATTVRKMFSKQGQRGGDSNFKVIPDRRSNNVLLRGDKQARMRARKVIASIDTKGDGVGGDTRVVRLRYANAADLVEVLKGVAGNLKKEGQGAEGEKADETMIQADEATNSLVINAPPEIQDEFDRIIQRLDVRRPQVLIEAAIAEVSADAAAELGFQFGALDDEGNGFVGGTSFESAEQGSLANVINSISNDQAINPGSGLSVGVAELAGGTRFATLLRALSSDTDTNILSTPSLTTLDNQEAEIRVVQNVPFVTGSFTGAGEGDSSSDPFQTIEREDVGIILKVTPQINQGDSVMLDLEQEVSSVTQSTQAVDLITDKRSIKTQVLADDGNLIMLGGLLDEQTTEGREQVPLLGDIPGVGRLFSYRSSSSSKRNLMLFLRPHIIRNSESMTQRANDNYDYMRSRQMANREEGVDLLDDTRAPALPERKQPEIPVPYGR